MNDAIWSALGASVPVVLALIAGGIRFGRLEQKVAGLGDRLDRDITGMHSLLGTRIEGLDTSIRVRIEGLDASMGARIVGLEASIGAQLEGLNKQFEIRDEQLTSQVSVLTNDLQGYRKEQQDDFADVKDRIHTTSEALVDRVSRLEGLVGAARRAPAEAES
ncbi:MAG: hypothetical protein M3323_06295 [Actinomycetota bacterium]|nr:hypothetical protein [Actinomycetota bacterium]